MKTRFTLSSCLACLVWLAVACDGGSTNPTEPTDNGFVEDSAWGSDSGSSDGPVVVDCTGVAEPSCGNGLVERPPPGCGFESEHCDGLELGGLSCEELSFEGGDLACADDCTLTAANCFDCVDGPQLLSCAQFEARPGVSWGLALAGSADGVAIAWASSDHTVIHRGDPHPLSLVVLDTDLQLIARRDEVAPDTSRYPDLAAVPGGYLLAVATGRTGARVVQLHPLDATGELRSPVVSIVGAVRPILVQRPDGGPLLFTGSGDGATHVSLLDADGNATWQSSLPADVDLGGNGVFVGNGFLLAVDLSDRAIGVIRVELDGTIQPLDTDTRIATSGRIGGVGSPNVTWDGTEGRITWVDTGQMPTADMWARIDAQGRRTSESRPLTGRVYGGMPVLARPDVTLVLVGGSGGRMDGANGLELRRFGADDLLTGYPNAVFDGDGAWDYRMAWVGDSDVSGEMVVAWSRSTRLPEPAYGWRSLVVVGAIGIAKVGF